MPILTISTNSTNSLTKRDLEIFNQIFADAIRKDPSICSVTIHRNPDQLFGMKEGNSVLVNFTLESASSDVNPLDWDEKYLERQYYSTEISKNFKRLLSNVFDVPVERIEFAFF